jgi:hypothetical protein
MGLHGTSSFRFESVFQQTRPGLEPCPVQEKFCRLGGVAHGALCALEHLAQVANVEIARSIWGASRGQSRGSAAPTTTVLAREPRTRHAISR